MLRVRLIRALVTPFAISVAVVGYFAQVGLFAVVSGLVVVTTGSHCFGCFRLYRSTNFDPTVLEDFAASFGVDRVGSR